MDKDQQIKETETEIEQLKAELIVCCNAIKDCKDSKERKILFEEKKEIQSDIKESEIELKTLNELGKETPIVETLLEQPKKELN